MSIIYERHYPEIEFEDPEVSENQGELANSAENLNFERIMEEIYKDAVYILLSEKQAAAREFLKDIVIQADDISVWKMSWERTCSVFSSR